MRRPATAFALAALSLIAASPAAAAPLIDDPGPLPEASSPVLIDQAQDKGTLSLERANLYRVYVLTGDDRLPAAYESDTPADATFLARRLQREFPLMEPGAARQTVSATLRPATPSAASRCFSSATVLPTPGKPITS